MDPKATTAAASFEPASDEQVVKRIVAGDVQAFEVLLLRHENLVAKIVASKVPSQETAEVTHLVFIRAFQSLGNYKPVAPFKHWLTTLAVRTCYDYWRKKKRNREVPLTSLSDGQRYWLKARGSHRDAGRELETENLLEWAMGHLSAADRMALTLVHLEGNSVSDAAELLGWTSANVKVRCFRARKKLRRLIDRELSGDTGNHE